MPEKVYIEREKVRDIIADAYKDATDGDAENVCIGINSLLMELPASDVRPNIPGKWIRENNPSYSPFDDSSEYLYRCSQCEAYNNRESAFCPDCGAQMRGGEQDGV